MSEEEHADWVETLRGEIDDLRVERDTNRELLDRAEIGWADTAAERDRLQGTVDELFERLGTLAAEKDRYKAALEHIGGQPTILIGNPYGSFARDALAALAGPDPGTEATAALHSTRELVGE